MPREERACFFEAMYLCLNIYSKVGQERRVQSGEQRAWAYCTPFSLRIQSQQLRNKGEEEQYCDTRKARLQGFSECLCAIDNI